MTTFIEAIIDYGYAAPREIVADGKIKRFATDANKRYSKDGWYVAYDDAKGKAGSFGSWRDGNKIAWSNDTGRQLTQDEWDDIERQRKAAFEEAKREKAEAAQRAKRIYEQASLVGESGYLLKKGITQPSGVRFVSDMPRSAFGYKGNGTITGMIIPVYAPSGVIATLQIITDDGTKLFMPNGSTSGGWFAIGGDWTTANCVVIAEGLATAQSIFEASGLPVLSAFNCGNLPKVAQMVRAKNAKAEILLAVDGDKAGREACEKAARAVNGRMIEAPEGMDWNDVHSESGLADVRKAFVTEEINALWKADLIVKTKADGSETIPCRAHNLILILRHDPQFKGRIRLNELSNQINIDGVDADDAAFVRIKAAMEKGHIHDKISTGDIADAMGVVGSENAFHPIRSYLSALRWDRQPRVVNMLSDYFGVESSDYSMAVSRAFMISAVARAMRPGCKVDMMVIFEGAQGKYKSTGLSTLFSEEWHSEITANIHDKDFFQNLRGKWFMEFGELSTFRKADAAHLKQVITARYDNYRPSYGRFNRDYPRQVIFGATTNDSDYLVDPTGARRYFPVICEHIDVDSIKRDRDQLWAEAVVLYGSINEWWVIPDAEKEQDDRYQADSWEEKVADWLDGRMSATITEILEHGLEIPAGKHSRADQTRIGQIMIRFKWHKRRDSVGGQRIWRYHRFP